MDYDHFNYLLRLGDDSLILGQRLGEWAGHAPSVEVDLSLSNLALDLIGQATHFLGLAGAVEGAGRDEDALAFRRDAFDFTNCLMVEQPNGDFAQTVARQLLFSTWQNLMFERLADSADKELAAVAAKASKEVTYHVRFAADWVERLGDGTEESHRRMASGLAWNWRFVEELFNTDEHDLAMIARGIGFDPAGFRTEYDAQIACVLRSATLTTPGPHRMIAGGRSGRHSEHLGHLLAEMQFLPRAYPDAKW
jgi:ring-1,2-phenylacetyl-CoA epoxidase subunit PaaC